MNKTMLAITIIALYTSQNSAMHKLPFTELYSHYSIAIGKHSSTQKEFYQKLLPYRDTPEIRGAIVSILENGETQENTLSDKQITTSLLNSIRITNNEQELNQAITMLDQLNEKEMREMRNYVYSSISNRS